MDPASNDETWDSLAGIVRLLEARCTVGVELDPDLAAAAAAADEVRSGAGEEEPGFADPDDVSSIFVDCAGVNDADAGGGELGGEDSCRSTSATSCASLFATGSGAASVITWSWLGSCSVSSLGASGEMDCLVGKAEDDAANSDANSPAAMVAVRRMQPLSDS